VPAWIAGDGGIVEGATPKGFDLGQFAFAYIQGTTMRWILLPVDGSPSDIRATQTLIDKLGGYKSRRRSTSMRFTCPSHVPNMGSLVIRLVEDGRAVRMTSRYQRPLRAAKRCQKRKSMPAR